MAEYRASEEEAREYAERIINTVREPLIFLDQDLRVISASRSFYEAFKVKPEETEGWLIYDLGDKQWDIPELRQLLEDLLPQKTSLEDYEVENEFADLGRRTMLVNAREIQRKSGKERLILLAIEDVTECNQAAKDLQKIEWMLSSQRKTRFDANFASEEPYVPPYEDLTKLNTNREILDAVGEETLKNIVGDFLDLLETSVAVYEATGDYALGIFSSNWCRLMDQASYHLCGTDDSAQALSCGKWLCHESCWNAAKQAIETGAPVDVECEGAIRLYAVPIRANGEIIGTINVGYGDPPTEVNSLSGLAKKYGVDVKDLVECSNAYESRPPFLIKLAKRRIHSAAHLIGQIVERKQAEAALRESEREKDLILNSTAEMIVYYDTDLKIIWANRAAAEPVDMHPDDLAGRRCYEIWRQQSAPCPDCPVLAAREACEAHKAEVQAPDGRYWAIRGYPVTNDEGDVIALVEFSQEITEQKHAQETSARLQEQFHQVQKLESIGRLAGGVAHDLNNLLSPILGYGEMLLEDAPANDPRLEPLEEIVSAGKRAQALVRQLLAFSRKQPLQFQSLDINDLLKGFKKLLRRTLREDINIQIHFGESIPQVEGDIGQIEQVIMNLAVNAQDAMPEGGTLTMETALVDLDENYAKQKNGVTAGPYVMLAISDNGTGMDKETLKHLFEPFFTTKEQGKGTGLGMPTAYGIIKQHGGNIWTYSEPGQGTTIKIYLPLPTKTRDAISHAEDRKPASKGVETVLLAEDDQQVRHLTTAILERYGYQVIVAGNGQEALSALKKHKGPIDLLITDVIMPDMNGKELYNKLSKYYPETRVLYMSGYTDNVIAHHGVIDPGVNFIEKPFNVKALAAKVREVLEE